MPAARQEGPQQSNDPLLDACSLFIQGSGWVVPLGASVPASEEQQSPCHTQVPLLQQMEALKDELQKAREASNILASEVQCLLDAKHKILQEASQLKAENQLLWVERYYMSEQLGVDSNNGQDSSLCQALAAQVHAAQQGKEAAEHLERLGQQLQLLAQHDDTSSHTPQVPSSLRRHTISVPHVPRRSMSLEQLCARAPLASMKDLAMNLSDIQPASASAALAAMNKHHGEFAVSPPARTALSDDTNLETDLHNTRSQHELRRSLSGWDCLFTQDDDEHSTEEARSSDGEEEAFMPAATTRCYESKSWDTKAAMYSTTPSTFKTGLQLDLDSVGGMLEGAV